MPDEMQNNHSLIENPEHKEKQPTFLDQQLEQMYASDDSGNPTLLSPDEALSQGAMPDTADQIFSRRVYENKVVNELKSLSPRQKTYHVSDYVLFPSHATFKEDGTPVVEYDKICIKSVPAHVMRNINKQYEHLEFSIPRKYDKDRDGQVNDWEHPKYNTASKALTEGIYQRRFDIILEGLDMPLEDNDGNVVWDTSKGTRNRKSAIAILMALGMSDKQLNWLEDHITELMSSSDENAQEAFKKRAMPLSEHLQN